MVLGHKAVWRCSLDMLSLGFLFLLIAPLLLLVTTRNLLIPLSPPKVITNSWVRPCDGVLSFFRVPRHPFLRPKPSPRSNPVHSDPA